MGFKGLAVLPLGILALFIGFFIGNLNQHFQLEPRVIDEEVYITGIDGPTSGHTYVVNSKRGLERIKVKTFWRNYTIDYDQKCGCVTSVYDDTSTNRVMFLIENGDVRIQTGETINKDVSYGRVREDFEKALAVRNSFRKKYEKVVSLRKS